MLFVVMSLSVSSSLPAEILLACSIPSNNGISDAVEFVFVHVNIRAVGRVEGSGGSLPLTALAPWPAIKEIRDSAETEGLT